MREADLYDDVMKKPSGVATAASELSGGREVNPKWLRSE